MTEIEAKGFVQGKLDCMEKCGVFNKEDNTSDNDCDNCEYCYSQGNFGNQKEAFQMAINALEKQIPKKVKIEQWIYTKCDCGYEFSRHHGDGYYSIPLENKTKYCPNCGQKLDWSDEE